MTDENSEIIFKQIQWHYKSRSRAKIKSISNNVTSILTRCDVIDFG